MVPVLAFLLAAASAIDVLNPTLRNSPYENLRELEAASAEPLTDLAVAESADVRHSVRSFFRQQTRRPPPSVPGPTPAAVLLHNLKNEDIDLAEAEKIVQNRKRAVTEHKRAAEVPIPNAVQVGDNSIEEEEDDDIENAEITTPGPFTPGFTDDAFYTSEPTSVPYTFESFPKIDLDKIRTTPITKTSDEGGGDDGEVVVDTPEDQDEAEIAPTVEEIEVVYPSAEVFTSERKATPLPTSGSRNQSKKLESAVVIQPTLSSGPLATFEDINAFLFHPPTGGSGAEEPASLSQQLKELEEQLIRESGETELLRETPKRKRKVGDPTRESNAVRTQLPLPAVAPPTSYEAPPRPRPESMEYVPVEEVLLEDVPLNGGDGKLGGESFLVVSKDDVALSQRVKEATHGWDDLDDDIITAIERVLAIDIPVDSKLLYRNPSPRVTRKSPKFPGSDNEIAENAKVRPIIAKYLI